MASNINPNNINGNYPVAGQDNDSQGFRDNFTNISNNFSFAATEITGLQNSMTNVQSTVGTDGNVTAYYGNVEQGLTVNGTTTLNDVVVNGNITLGDNDVDGSGTEDYDAITPSYNNSYNLGSPLLNFGNAYVTNVYANVSSATNSVHYYRIEQTSVVGTAPASIQPIDVLSGARWFFTANAANNSTLNFRGSASTTFANVLAVGQSMKVEVALTQGSTGYYPNAHQIDGVAQTVKWLSGVAPTLGNINSINTYNYTITKTVAPSTYSIIGYKSVYF